MNDNLEAQNCVEALPNEQRKRLARELGRVVGYCAPNANARTQ
jgi:hypothetical protein